MRRRAAVLFLIVALVLGALTAWVATSYLKRRSQAVKRPQIKLYPVVVARAALPVGTKLEIRGLRLVRYPIGAVPQGSFRKVKDVAGRVLKISVTAGEPILSTRLAKKGIRGGMSAVVNPKFRAMAVKVNDYVGVGGFIQPSDRVDVLVTFSKGLYRDNPVSRLVVQNVKVLAWGRTVAGSPEDRKQKRKAKRARARVVTLEVTPVQAERLHLAASWGKLSLALRSQGDGEPGIALGIAAQTMVPLRRRGSGGKPSLLEYLRRKALERAKKKPGKTKKVKKTPIRPVRRSYSIVVIHGGTVSKQSY